MAETKVDRERGIGDKRGSQGRFADNADNKVSQKNKKHEGLSQGGRGLSQSHDHDDKISREGTKNKYPNTKPAGL